MARKLFGIGTHGGIVADLQRVLVSARFGPARVDQRLWSEDCPDIAAMAETSAVQILGIFSLRLDQRFCHLEETWLTRL